MSKQSRSMYNDPLDSEPQKQPAVDGEIITIIILTLLLVIVSFVSFGAPAEKYSSETFSICVSAAPCNDSTK